MGDEALGNQDVIRLALAFEVLGLGRIPIGVDRKASQLEKAERHAMTTEERKLCLLAGCPICKGKVRFVGAYLFLFINNLAIECTVCGLRTRSGQFESENELAEFWNRHQFVAEVSL